MKKRQKARANELAQLESEFHSLLVTCLEQCARGRWGLFGQNDYLDPGGRYWTWPEAARVKELASDIQSIYMHSGEVNVECERFLQLCSMRGSNVPGEPKLAAEWLATVNSRHNN